MRKSFSIFIIASIVEITFTISEYIWGKKLIENLPILLLPIWMILIVIAYYFEWRENKKSEEKEKLEEKLKRPNIRFNIEPIEEVGDYITKSNFVIKNIRPENKASGFKIKVLYNEKVIKERDLKTPINNKFTFKIQKEFAKSGKYFIYLWFKSELNNRYRAETTINCVEEPPLKYWRLDRTKEKFWIKREKFKDPIEEENKWPNMSK